jgi:hypothetical protein
MLVFSKFWNYVRSHTESVVLCPGKDQVTGCGSVERAFGSGGLPPRCRGPIVLPELDEGFLDAAGAGGCEALVDGKGLLQAGGGFAGVAVAEVAVADSFQGACFFLGGADLAGDRQCPGVVLAGLAAAGGPGR